MGTLIGLIVVILFCLEFFCIRRYDNKVNKIKMAELNEYKTKYFTLRDLLYPEE